jgi:hypothetical protein
MLEPSDNVYAIRDFKWYFGLDLLVFISDKEEFLHFPQGIIIHGDTESVSFRRCHDDYQHALSLVDDLGVTKLNNTWSYTADVGGKQMWAVLASPIVS